MKDYLIYRPSVLKLKQNNKVKRQKKQRQLVDLFHSVTCCATKALSAVRPAIC